MRRIILYFLSAMFIASQAFSCEPIDSTDPPVEDTPGQGQEPGAGEDPGTGEEPGQGEVPTESYYVKVAQSYEDWSGDYLITYTSGSKVIVLNGFADTKGTGKDISSSLTSEGIHSSVGDQYKATVVKDGSGYTINVADVGYIGLESSKNSLNVKTASASGDSKYQWTLSYKSGIWVSNVGNSGRRLQWNASASIFRCYTGSQEEITLYKRTTSAGTVTPTPDPEDPTPDNPEPDNPDPEDPDPDQPGQGGTGQEPESPVTPPTGSSGMYGWYELPVMNYAKEGSTYLTETTSKYGKVYYAHHFCAGGEKYAHNGKTARNYTVCYSAKHHCPVWVAAIRHNSLFPSKVSRTDSYGKDPSIPSDIQYNSKSTGGGCNKGHMLGSKERTSSTATNKQVFYYTNIAPQKSSTFNTGGGGWNTLEDWVDGKVCSDTLYMVIGAYFDSFTDPRGISDTPSTISFGGRSDVSCPTMFYYALLRTKNGNTGKPLSQCSSDEIMCAAFVRSHETPMKTAVSKSDMMSISDLEKITGFSYFPNVPNAPKSSYKASDWGL